MVGSPRCVIVYRPRGLAVLAVRRSSSASSPAGPSRGGRCPAERRTQIDADRRFPSIPPRLEGQARREGRSTQGGRRRVRKRRPSRVDAPASCQCCAQPPFGTPFRGCEGRPHVTHARGLHFPPHALFNCRGGGGRSERSCPRPCLEQALACSLVFVRASASAIRAAVSIPDCSVSDFVMLRSPWFSLHRAADAHPPRAAPTCFAGVSTHAFNARRDNFVSPR